jgi:hypothetical protein
MTAGGSSEKAAAREAHATAADHVPPTVLAPVPVTIR